MRILLVTRATLQQLPTGPTSGIASARYRVLIPAHELVRLGHEVQIVAFPPGDLPASVKDMQCDVLILSKSFDASAEELAAAMQKRGTKVIADFCDDHFDNAEIGPRFRSLAGLADTLVASTPAMADAIRRHTGRESIVITDPVEGPGGAPAFAPRSPELRIAWFGHPINLNGLEARAPELHSLAARMAARLTVVTDPTPAANAIVAKLNARDPARLKAELVPWSLEATWKALEQCDLAWIPVIDSERTSAKSPNRLLEALWAGRLVVADPVPSYQPFADLVPIGMGLEKAVVQALEDPARVEANIGAARRRIAQSHSALECGRQWASAATRTMTPQGEAYVRWFHESNVWKTMTWHGIRTLKLPSDAWNYQEIIFERAIEHVIETGTRHGGSALFFAEALMARGGDGRVVSIDIDPQSRQLESHERITFLIGDSAAPEMVDRALALLPAERGPIFLILDSDHRHAHVLRELRAWVPKLRAGDYLVVEDTIVNGHPVRPVHGPGPWEAIEDYLAEAPGLLVHDAGREAKFGATVAPRGHYVRA